MANSGNIARAPFLEILDGSKDHTFSVPLKKISDGHDISTFHTCKAYVDILTFLLQLNRAVFPSYMQNSDSGRSKAFHTWEVGSSEVQFSKTVLRLRSMLEALDQIIDEVPPDTGPRRFGNASFRKWYEAVEQRSTDLLAQALPDTVLEYAAKRGSGTTPQDEILSYFLGGFGSAQRLDYGSGHELSFLAFLGCIWKLGGFAFSNSGNEERGIILGVIDPYLSLIRRLIKTYTLEPAGSHGVWGLDDHSFIPYIFGSAQYGPPISPEDQTPTEGSREDAPNPADVAKKSAVARERNKNMYFGAIGFIHDVKKGPFWEHSPMLYDISGIQAGWGKINKGMIKMYNAEVLSKFPVVQHFRFGSLFSWDQDPAAPPPLPSVHASSQPVRDASGASLENASARPQPHEVTKAPWANKPAAMPNAGTIAVTAPWATTKPLATISDASTRATAPWTSETTPTSGISAARDNNRSPIGANPRVPPSRFATEASREISPRTDDLPPRTNEGSRSDTQAVPPPHTQAPWAR